MAPRVKCECTGLSLLGGDPGCGECSLEVVVNLVVRYGAQGVGRIEKEVSGLLEG